ncbi:UNKNOWN [Stylonychia lemnae]|uniref:Uncharacterized protein n=1 Tax=Stylonychia lemnae TaxID=5949 RepID=A0A078B3V8_STYLE|nr:UNKNOWN [Stylonychia lemnae]|eukprot:CDW89174.1 UNKNOWN [Stylonychia lemnae]
MSNLGWTTQSAFIPKESKKISVAQNSSLIDLKAKIIEEKAKLTQSRENKIDANKQQFYLKRKDLFKGGQQKLQDQNKGIEQRLLKDEQEFENNRVEDDHGQIDSRKIQFKLAEKAQIYEQLINEKKSHENKKSGLVDFEQKRWNEKDDDQNRHDYLSEMNRNHDLMARERKAWEEEARNEIEAVDKGLNQGQFKKLKDSATAMLGQSMAPLVKQQWDNILSKKEKDQLPEVIMDKEKQQKLQILAKRKRDQDRESRLQKIEELKKRQRTN